MLQEHAHEVTNYLDALIRRVLASGAVVEPNRAVVLAALQVTGELFDARVARGDEHVDRRLERFRTPAACSSKRAG
jgi:cell division protein ZapA (FtsZ GTPase activity inhibitor)